MMVNDVDGEACVKKLIIKTIYQTWNTLYGSFSWTSSAAARIRPCLSANASASSSTRPPLAVFTRNAPGLI